MVACPPSTPQRSSPRVQRAIVERNGIEPTEVGQVVTGCVSQVGEQAFNIGRTAWLAAGLPLTVANTTIDTQCGSSQQATNLATSLVGSGVVDMALACGVEAMSRVPIGASGNKEFGLGIPIPPNYFEQYEMTSQFEGAERIADKWGITRDDTDAFGLRSRSSGPRRHGRRTASRASTSRSRHPTSTTRASRPARPTPSTATRACARPRSRSSPR